MSVPAAILKKNPAGGLIPVDRNEQYVKRYNH